MRVIIAEFIASLRPQTPLLIGRRDNSGWPKTVPEDGKAEDLRLGAA
jgi:hypothetical protein